MTPRRLHVLACAVFQRELELLVKDFPLPVTFRFLEMGLHEKPAEHLRAALQAAVDDVKPAAADAIAIAYGLCNRGILGLRAGAVPLVLPRAHDCIGILLGKTRCYLAQLESQPGTYFQSAGWMEHAPENGGVRQQNLSFGPGSTLTREPLAEKYGEDNADYLLEQFARFTRQYERLAFIATPVPEAARWEAVARKNAQDRGWKFERLAGDLGWLRRLLEGEWNEHEFLTVPPGQQVVRGSEQMLMEAGPLRP